MEQTHLANLKIFLTFITVSLSSFSTYIELNKYEETLFLLTILLIIDYITGILKARRLKQSITSNKMKYGILSKLLLLIVPLVLAISAKALKINIDPLILTSLSMLVLSEVYSILANIYSYRTAKELPEIEVIGIIGKKVRNFLLALDGDKSS